MYRRQVLRRLLCHGEPTETPRCLLCDKLKYWSNLHISITARAVVSASIWEMKSDLSDSLESEANHTVDDIHGVEAFVAFQHPLKIQKWNSINMFIPKE